MADDNSGGFEAGSTTSFSQLLFSEDDAVLGLDIDGQSLFSSFCANNEKPPKMLCFGDYNQDDGAELVLFGTETPNNDNIIDNYNNNSKNITTPLQKYSSAVTSDSSSASSGNSQSNKSNKTKNGAAGRESVQGLNSMAANATQKTSKKSKTEQNPSSTGHAKARKEKLGERITTLQQLVSPFGKTDTASVLHEAMGYIRFLHDQVQVLCSPYLQHHLPEGGENGGEESRKDLRSRGLCLVPVASTVHVANNNGADFWSPAMGNHAAATTTVSPSSIMSSSSLLTKQ